jgi:TRAP-type mannitol/chloroaromatic compound transport system permease small subunit
VEWVVRGVGGLGFVLFPVLILVCVYEVAARYLFNAPTIWAFDITFMVHGALFMLTGAYGLQHRMHVRIDVLSVKLPLSVQHAANIVAYLFFFIPAMWLSSDAAFSRMLSAYRTDEVELASAWGPAVWPFYLGIAVGAGVMFLQSCVETVRHAIGIIEERNGRNGAAAADRVV